MKKLFILLFLVGACWAQTYNTSIYPAQPGLFLGKDDQRWSGFFQDVNISGTLTVNGGLMNVAPLPAFGDGQKTVTTSLANSTPNYCAIWAATSALGQSPCALLINGLVPPAELVTGDATNSSLCVHGGPSGLNMGACAAGTGVRDVVRDYGADPTGAVDARPLIQSALEASCAETVPTPVYIPAGSYYIGTAPIHLHCSKAVLYGAPGRNSVSLFNHIQHAPTIIVGPGPAEGYTGVPTVAALVTGEGSALAMDGTDDWWFNLRDDTNAVELNGLAAFTVEAFLKPTSFPGGYSNIVASSGRRGSNEAVSQAFEFGTSAAVAYGMINIGGTPFILNGSSSLSLGVVHHLALTYDGTTIRLFVDGVMENSSVHAGTITQSFTEDVTVGPTIQGWPESTMLNAMENGVVDSIRLSKSARYTANFTPPTAKLTDDANCLVLMNFVTQADIWTLAHAKASGNAGFDNSFLIIRRPGLFGSISENEVSNLQIRMPGNTGIYQINNTNSRYSNIKFLASVSTVEPPVAFKIWNNSFENHYTDLMVTGSVRVGISASGAVGVNYFDYLNIQGGKYQMAFANGSALLNQPFFANTSETIMGLFVKSSGSVFQHVHLVNAAFDNENSSPNYINNIFISGGNFMDTDGDIDNNGLANIAIDAPATTGSSLTFVGTHFNNATPGSVPSIFHIITAPPRPIQLVNVSQNNDVAPQVPWTDVAGTVSMIGNNMLSFGAATWTSGTGSPESVVTAAVGSMYTRTNGGAGTTLYVKESGSGATGWIAK